MLKKITTLLLVFCCLYTGKTQELQFNQWQFAPALMNPALTGAYQGSFRVGGIIKDKWASVDSRSWKTMEVYVDAPIIRGIRKSDWIAVGIGYDIDQAGTSLFNQQFQRASIAYHLGFGKKYKSAFTIAGQFSNWNLKAENADLSLIDEGSLRNQPSEVAQIFQAAPEGTLNTDNKRWTAAIGYKSQMNKKSSIGFGLSVSQFLPNDRSLLTSGGVDELPVRYIGFFNMKSMTGKRTSFEPQIVFTKQSANSKLFLQGIFGFKPKKSDWTFKYGAGLNAFVNAINIPLYAGIEKGSLRVGLAYAVDLSEIAATSTYGGFELAASYIHVLAKKPEPKPVIICPRL